MLVSSGTTRNYQRGMTIKVKKTFLDTISAKFLRIPLLTMLNLTKF